MERGPGLRATRKESVGSGLQLFVGPNEAGKSSTLAFLSRVLAGPSAGASRVDEAGWVELTDGEGCMRIDAAAARRQSLKELSPKRREALATVDAKVFRALFAFGLDELAALESLDVEGLRERIFCAGLEGAGEGAGSALRRLEAKARRLWRPRGQSRIADLLESLEALEGRRLEARRQQMRHSSLRAAERDLGDGLEELAEERERLRDEARRWEGLISLWPQRRRRDADLQRLRELRAPSGGDPEGLEARWSALNAHEAGLDAQVAEVLSELERLRGRRESLDDRLWAQRHRWRALLAERVEHQARCDRAEGLRRAMREDGSELRRLLGELGSGWDLATLRAYRPEAGRRARLRRFAAEIGALRRALESSAPMRPAGPGGLWSLWLLPIGLLAFVFLPGQAGPLVGGIATGAALVALAGERQQRRREVSGEQEAEATLRVREADFDDWRRASGLGAGGEPDELLERLSLLDTGHRVIERLATRRRTLAEIEEEINAWEQPLRAELLRLERRLPEDSRDLMRRLLIVEGRLGEEREGRRRREERSEARALLLRRLRRLRAQLEEDASEREQLQDLVGAETEEQWPERLEALREATLLRASLIRRQQELDERLGADEEGRSLTRELERGRFEEWRRALDYGRERLSALADDERELLRRQRELELERRAIEGGADLQDLELQRASLVEGLRGDEAEWRALKLARRALEETIEQRVNEGLPRVLRRAEGLLDRVSEGRHVRVLREGRLLLLVDRDGRKRAPEELSRGTRDLLYIALRLALIEEVEAQGLVRPLLLDDVLVNFDGGRADRLAAELARFAEGRQLLYFSCHESVARRFRSVAPELTQHAMATD